MRTHVDLFSGIGGFTLAAHANGVRTIQFCEIDARCRDFLGRAWPGIPIHDDVRTFGVADGERDGGRAGHTEREPVGRAAAAGTGAPVWLLTAGVPCQPASRAGKQRGSADDRWLWPEALRLLRHYNPTWALFENPAGIADVGLAGILAQVEAEGYEVRVHSVPACAVGAPHRRERYWIVAHAQEVRERPGGPRQPRSEPWADSSHGDESTVAHRSQAGREGCECANLPSEERREDQVRPEPALVGGWVGHATGERGTPRERGEQSRGAHIAAAGSTASSRDHWADFVWLPCADGKVRRAPGDAIGLVDGLHRSVLGALGNSVVPQVAEVLIRAMIQAEEEE